MSIETERNHMFQHTVLMVLWLIFLYVAGKRRPIYNARDAVISFGDLYGVEGEEAKQFRREHTYWWMD